MPMRGIFGGRCCALATIGQPAVEPAITLMKSLRRTQSPVRLRPTPVFKDYQIRTALSAFISRHPRALTELSAKGQRRKFRKPVTSACRGHRLLFKGDRSGVLCHAFSDCPRGENEDACSDEASDQIACPTAERDTEQAEQPASDCGPYDAQDDVHDKPHLAFHELLGEPASDPTNDDGCNPAYLGVLHGYLLICV